MDNRMKSSSCIRCRDDQRGVVLLVALVLLVMITLFAVSSIRSSTTQLQIVGNDQLRKELSAATQECIEEQLNSMVVFNNLVNGIAAPASCTTQGGRYTVTLAQIVCRKAEPLGGSSLVQSSGGGSVSVTEITYWELVATATENNSGATITTTQGFRMRMPLASCP